MHWKTKAQIQNVVAILPASLSYAAYYWLQRNFGGLKKMDPIGPLKAGVETWRLITKFEVAPEGKVFLEVGTGRAPLTPLAYWLMGAKSIITIDQNRYMRDELITESLSYIAENTDEVQKLFEPFLNNDRLNALLDFAAKPVFSIDAFLQLTNITYIAPGDAAQTGLQPGTVDYHTSYNVLEHIPPQILRDILEEGNRVIAPDGLFVHRIDYSDHFAHSDSSISAINFIKYTDAEWNKLAGNRYMYMNRLRHDDFLGIFGDAGHSILSSEAVVDERSLALLRSGDFQVDQRFRQKSENTLSIVDSWMVTHNAQ